MFSGGEPSTIAAEAAEHGLEHVLIDHELAGLDAYQVTGTPSAVLIASDGTIASYVASGSTEIEQLVERAVAPEETYGLSIGAAVPDLPLRGLDGRSVSLGDPTRSTLVLFWNPGCGFCRELLDDLSAWEQAGDESLRLLVVSSGDEDESRADGFRSTVVLDSDFALGNALGAGGTPMAVLLDREGRVASELVAGGESVLALISDHAHSTELTATS